MSAVLPDEETPMSDDAPVARDGDPTSGDAPAVALRGEALGCGWGCGTLVVGALVAAGFMIAHANAARWLLPFGAGAAVVGIVLRAYAASTDRKLHRRERAPRLPIALAPVDEPVWITAEVDCPCPVAAPETGVPCVWLHVRVQVRRGKHTRTLRDERTAVRAWLVDAPEHGGGRVELDLAKVAFERIPSWNSRDGSETTTVWYLPAQGRISACGVLRRERRPTPPQPSALWASAAPSADARSTSPTDVEDSAEGRVPPGGSDGAQTGSPDRDDGGGDEALVLRGEETLPLLVTPLTRHAWTEYAETEELRARTGGTALLVGGTAVAAAALGAVLQWWRIDSAAAWVAGPAAAVVLVAPWLAWASLRQVKACRARAEDAAAALEADLARAADDPRAAGVRVAARLAVYDQLATEHNELLRVAPMRWIRRFVRTTPLPIRSDGPADGARGAPSHD